MKEKEVIFNVVPWLPCSEEEVQNRTPCVGSSSTTRNESGQIDSVLTVYGNRAIAVCSDCFNLRPPPEGFIFKKKG